MPRTLNRSALAAPAVLAWALVVVPSCGNAGGARAAGETLVLTGSSTLAPLAAEIGRRFEQRHPGVRVDVQTGGSSRGINDALAGRADLGMSSRALAEEERDVLESHLVAWDGVAFVVHSRGEVGELSDGQLRRILTGEIQRWREVGGADAEIVLVSRADGRSELDLVAEYFGLDATEIEADVIGGETQQVVKTVAANPHAISYLSLGAAEHAIASGSELRLLPLAGVEASSQAVRRGAFPLARPLLLAAPLESAARDRAPLVQSFVEFARSDAVADLIEALSFVPAD